MVSHTPFARQQARRIDARIAVVIGPNHEGISAAVTAMAPAAVVFTQSERLGTGHAVRHGAGGCSTTASGNVIVLYADTSAGDARRSSWRRSTGQARCGRRYACDGGLRGRRIRRVTAGCMTDGARLLAIREHKDATEAGARGLGSANSGIMGFKGAVLAVGDRPASATAMPQGEFYLTDAIELANADKRLQGQLCGSRAARDVIGVDDRSKLAKAEAQFQDLRRDDFMKAGVTLKDPATVHFSYDTEIGRDVTIWPNVVFGAGVKIADNVEIRSFCDIEDVTIGTGATIGPFARIRGGAENSGRTCTSERQFRRG